MPPVAKDFASHTLIENNKRALHRCKARLKDQSGYLLNQ